MVCVHVVGVNWSFCNHMQFEQEFGLILGKSSAKQAFISEWCTKYVPAIISYGERNTKRAIREILEHLNNAGEMSIVSLTVLFDV